MPSGTARLVLVLTLFVTVGVIFLGPISSVTASTTGTQTVTNETVTADYDSAVDLDGYDVSSGSETVWGYNDTSGSYEQASSGTDYTLNPSEGSIEFNSSSSLIQDGEEAKVTYDYEAAGPLVSTVIEFIPVVVASLLLAVIALRVGRLV